MRRRLRIVIVVASVAALIGLATLGFAWWRIARCSSLTHDGLKSLPHRKVALVLGCSPKLRDGSTNYFFIFRMDAAAKLLKNGKVDYLLVSGDNRRRDYDEPTAMKQALIARGVPASA